MHRCQNFVQRDWRKRLLKLKEETVSYPDFEVFSKFMTGIAANVNDPAHGNENFYHKSKVAEKKSHNVSQATVSVPQKMWTSLWPTCEASHRMRECERFKDMSLQDRFKFVSEKRLGFNCFYMGHRTL